MKKKGILLGVLLCAAVCSSVLLLMVLIQVRRTDRADMITRADVARMTAALFCDPSSIEAESTDETWDQKYIRYLQEQGYMSGSAGQSGFTYGDLTYMLKGMNISLDDIAGTDDVVRWKQNYISTAQWYVIYDYLIAYFQAPVVCVDLTVLGTPSNVQGMEEWTALTSDGNYSFEGVALDSSIDSVVRVLVRDHVILEKLETVSGDVTYRNVWILESSGEQIHVYMNGITRDFQVNGLTENLQKTLADIIIIDQQVAQLNLKQDVIKGKILSLTDEQVEIEGYGKVGFDPEYRLYKLYGGFGEASFDDLVVGYDRQEFIVADGRICAVTISYPFKVENIRVLIEDTGFENMFHKNVQVSSGGGLKVIDTSSETVLYEAAADEIVDLAQNLELSGGMRVRIEPVLEEQGLRLESITRGSGVPEYPGTLEIEASDGVYYIINDVNLEEYLKLVVPSEMPVSYGLESLKAQAVCARSYAYIQLFDKTNRVYGAHINDSTAYQVYNNSGRSTLADEAVDATCGEVIKYNGNVVEAFYYSTSCGYGSDISVWDEETQEYGYLVSRSISSEDTQLDLTDNTVFYNFISRRSLNDYDVSTPYYRWKAYLSMDEINSYYGEKAKVGTILSMSVDRRLAGGIAVELTVHGENGDYKVCGEYAIRQFLGNYAIYWRNDLESLFQMNYLPSAYIALRERSYNGQILGYDIIGGGYGHGVGMSQNAAHKMAQRGMDYKKIIHFFYQNVSIDTLY